MTGRRRVGLLTAVLALAAAGCGSLDTGKAEKQIAQIIESQVGVTVSSVDCPENVKPQAGNVFTCTATAPDGTAAEITVAQRDDKGNVHISAPLVNVRRLEQVLGAKIGGDLRVDCPDLVTAKRGDSFSCDATGPQGGSSTVEVTFTDDQGNVRFAVQNHG